MENQSVVNTCVQVFNIPAGGLECDLEATVSVTTSGNAGLSSLVIYISLW